MLDTLTARTCSHIHSFQGFRRLESRCGAANPAQVVFSRRCTLTITANKKVVKKQKVVLKEDLPLGTKGTIIDVPNGYFRNYLKPQNLAALATTGILENIEREQRRIEQHAREVKAKAQAMAIALSTIGKFVIKKKVGDGDKIFGSVTTAEVVEAIFKQTGQELNKKDVELPEMLNLGSYAASIRLHPEVVGQFTVVVQREKNVG